MGSFDDVCKAQDPLAEPRQALRTCRGVQATRTEARDKGAALRRIPALGIDVWRRILEQAGLTGTRWKPARNGVFSTDCGRPANSDDASELSHCRETSRDFGRISDARSTSSTCFHQTSFDFLADFISPRRWRPSQSTLLDRSLCRIEAHHMQGDAVRDCGDGVDDHCRTEYLLAGRDDSGHSSIYSSARRYN